MKFVDKQALFDMLEKKLDVVTEKMSKTVDKIFDSKEVREAFDKIEEVLDSIEVPSEKTPTEGVTVEFELRNVTSRDVLALSQFMKVHKNHTTCCNDSFSIRMSSCGVGQTMSIICHECGMESDIISSEDW